jgi:hypothetical protein
MNERIKELAIQAKIQMVSEPRLQEFADLIIDECCLKLIDMHEKTNGNHNLYQHAALEVARHFGDEK